MRAGPRSPTVVKAKKSDSAPLAARIREGLVLPVDKPAGITSHDVVALVRRALGTRKVGHTGTLDPFATGLLLICVGPATRLSEYLLGLPKTYLATARLGITTSTLDLEGEVQEERPIPDELAAEDVEDVLRSLRGEILQVPPQFSAKKVAGEAMHRRARRGESVELAPVPVTVYSLELLGRDGPLVEFSTNCSGGTYVRALARDLGEGLGCGAHLTALRRTAIGEFSVDEALTVEELQDPAAVEERALRPGTALLRAGLPGVTVDEAEVVLLAAGRFVPWDSGRSEPSAVEEGEPVAVLSGDRLVAVGRIEDGSLRPKKVLASQGDVPVSTGEPGGAAKP